MYIIKLHY